MGWRSRLFKKCSSDSASSVQAGELRSRSFNSQSPATASQQPDLQTKLEAAQNLGHHLADLPSRPFTSPSPSEQPLPDLQAQLEAAQKLGHHLQDFSSTPDQPRPLIIQPKLTIGAPGDKYEQEADRVAQQVVQRLHSPQSIQTQSAASVQREMGLDEEETVQLKPLLQCKASTAAVAASSDLETAIEQSRSGGQPLAGSIRQPLEQAFGNTDFSGVRVHTDAQADQLSRSIQAKAFTTGQDVFFRQGAYQPDSRGGQELIAHELTHVVQQNHSIVMQSPSLQQKPVEHSYTSDGQMDCAQSLVGLHQHNQTIAQAPLQDVIQRNVGFEFEVSGYPVTKMTRNILPGEASGTNIIPNTDLDDSVLTKATVMARKTGFELQIDEGAHDKHLEFVTSGNGFSENKAGRAALKTAMEGMEALGHEVEQKVAASPTQINNGMGNQQVIQTGEISGGVPTRPETLIYGGGQMEAEPQTTAGIRLDQIPSLIGNMARQPGETPQQSQARGVDRSVMAGKSNAADTAAMRTAVGDVRTAIANFRNQMQLANVVLPNRFGSEKLVGLMSLIYVYLNKARSQVNDYPKSLFPMLGITDFATMFGMLPVDDQAPFTANSQRFEDINLDAAGLVGAGATAFFAGGFAAQLTNMTLLQSQQTAAALGTITRHDWLTDIPNGVDRLSKGYATVAMPGAAPAALESMGKFNRGEQVGKTHTFSADTLTNAPILELRRHLGHLGINNWKDWALDMYDFIVAMNDLKTGRFEGDRYDFQNPK